MGQYFFLMSVEWLLLFSWYFWAFKWLKMDTMIDLSVVSSLFNLVFSYFCHFINLCTVVASDYAISLGNTLVLTNFLPILWKLTWSALVPRPSSPLASSPGPSQILSRSHGEKLGEGLGSKLRNRPEMVDSVSTNRVHSKYWLSPPFPVRDVVLITGLLPIFLHGCEIKSGSGLGTRLGTLLSKSQKTVCWDMEII